MDPFTPPDGDDHSAAAEIRRLREDQQRARSRMIAFVVVLVVLAAVVYSMWQSDQDAEKLGECIRNLNVPVEEC